MAQHFDLLANPFCGRFQAAFPDEIRDMDDFVFNFRYLDSVLHYLFFCCKLCRTVFCLQNREGDYHVCHFLLDADFGVGREFDVQYFYCHNWKRDANADLLAVQVYFEKGEFEWYWKAEFVW